MAATTATAAASSGDAAIATAASDAPDSSSKSATPQPPAKKTLAHRDKDSFNKMLIDQYITRDWVHSASMKNAQLALEERTKTMLDKTSDYKSVRQEHRAYFPPTVLYGPGYSGYGNGYTELGAPARILYPLQKWSQRPRSKATPPLKYSRKDMRKQADQHEELVPVRLDVEWDKIKLRDTFTWNLHERIIVPELFAAQLVEDMGLKTPVDKPVYDQILAQIHDQLNDFYPFAYSEEDALDPELPYSAYKNDEMRILVKLNITIGAYTLVDQFEWEINNPVNSPEEFASSMARDLALSGEFTTAIAHCIREQTQLFTRSLYSIGHPFDGRPIEDPDLTAGFLPSPLPTVFRPQQQAKEYAPFIYELSEADLERNETIFSREQRRQKRSVNRRGGPQLPDLKERQRTIRTLVVSSVLPGAALDIEESRLYKRAAGAALSGRSKRNARDGDLSDSEESEDSAPDSPAMSQLQGTARTRGLRGAANTAAQRMANIGRSETPEATIHHHETRTSRRFGRELTREDTDEPQHHIITLKVNPLRLKKLFRDMRTKPATASGPGTPSGQNHQRPPSAAAGGSMGPPSTPSAPSQALPARNNTPSAPPQPQIGGVPAPPRPGPGERPPQPPPPPDWLVSAVKDLSAQYPDDSFEGVMRYCAVDAVTEQTVPTPPAGQPVPPDVKFMFLPRIRCHDCPGKLYTPGPETTIGNFEVHLKNRLHRDKVNTRVNRGPGKAS